MSKRVLVLAPHTDDGELACGATISKMLRNGIEVFYVAFSTCEESLPDGLKKEDIINELYKATSVLGIKRDNIKILDYKVRYFEDNRQSILDDLIKICNQINPDVVFSPSVHDVHQDHVTIAKECIRAFKKKTILQYEVPWNNLTFDNQLFITVDDIDVRNKVAAVACYKTQVGKKYVEKDFIEGLMITHGVQIGAEYAEVFEAPRIIVKELV